MKRKLPLTDFLRWYIRHSRGKRSLLPITSRLEDAYKAGYRKGWSDYDKTGGPA